jgi:hypothetical protein
VTICRASATDAVARSWRTLRGRGRQLRRLHAARFSTTDATQSKFAAVALRARLRRGAAILRGVTEWMCEESQTVDSLVWPAIRSSPKASEGW